MAVRKQAKGTAGPAEERVSYATPALDKGLDVLELLAHERGGLMKSEIARALDRTISEIFRMLLCLERRGYILQAGDDRYVLSLKLFQLAQEHPPTERLLAEALPHMHAIAAQTQHSCHLGVLQGGKVVILAQINAPTSVGFFVKSGAAVDLMEAATGQVILAHLPPESRDHVLEEWRRETGRRIPAEIPAHLNRIRRRGYEKRASYQVRGVTNISFPVFDANGRAVAAITVPYFQRLKDNISIPAIEKVLAAATRSISTAIGAR